MPSLASVASHAVAEGIALSKVFDCDLAVAVTGAGGYIGSALVEALENHGCRTLTVSSKQLIPGPNGHALHADVGNLDCWMEVVQFADVIFHLAGCTSVYAADSDPTESLNTTLLPVTQLLKAVSKIGRKPRVIMASTATIYGLTESLPVAENVMPNPITVYDLHKLFAELQLNLASSKGMLEGVSLRLANVYGPSKIRSGSADRGILNRVAVKALQGEEITIFGGGNHLRDYVYIDDVVKAFLAAGLAIGSPTGVFNVGTGNAVTINDAFRLVGQQIGLLTGNRVSFKIEPWPIRADPIELRNYAANFQKIHETFGWTPLTSLEEGIRLLINSIK